MCTKIFLDAFCVFIDFAIPIKDNCVFIHRQDENLIVNVMSGHLIYLCFKNKSSFSNKMKNNFNDLHNKTVIFMKQKNNFAQFLLDIYLLYM